MLFPSRSEWSDEARDILVICAGTLASALIIALFHRSISKLSKVAGL